MSSRVFQHIVKLPGYKIKQMTPVLTIKKKKIVLVREGCTNRPFFTIQVKFNTQRTNEHGLEQLGSWDPLPNSHGEQLVAINSERFQYWLAQNAVPDKRVAQLLSLGGFLPMHPRNYLWAHRHRLKEAACERDMAQVKEDQLQKESDSDNPKVKLSTWGLEKRFFHKFKDNKKENV